MGFYNTVILPKLVHHVCSAPAFMELRAPFISTLHGVGLELGVGTGLNFPFYNIDKVPVLYTLEPCPVSLQDAKKKATKVGLNLQILEYYEQVKIPLEDHSVDFVVSTWTLCTIKDVVETLQETRRILKPNGRLFFMDHGRSPETFWGTTQDILNPLQKSFGGGCNLNRKIDELIIAAGFTIEKLDCFYMDAIKIGAYIYRGQARP